MSAYYAPELSSSPKELTSLTSPTYYDGAGNSLEYSGSVKSVSNLPGSTPGHGWPKLTKIMSEHDERNIKDCKEDMDTLLVFAGLFSAVLTAFNVESYKTLQSDPADTTNLLLAQISQQLNGLTLNGDATSPRIELSGDMPESIAVWINSLWFSALVCSLATASLAILVKQWLREYMAQDDIAPRSRVRIRFWRWLGLTKWRVFEIAAFLPMLLQIALGLFFAGLCVMVLWLHPVVGWIVTSLILLWLSFYISVTLAPVFSSKCPYKTPLLKSFLKGFRRTIEVLKGTFGWQSYPVMRGEEEMVRQDMSLDVPILVAADAAMMDDEFVATTLRECLSGADGREVIVCVKDIIAHRSGRELDALHDVRVSDLQRLTNTSRSAVVDILIDAVYREMHTQVEAGHTVKWVPWISSALICVGSALMPLYSASQRATVQTTESRAGRFLIRLLSENEETAKGVLEVLSRSQYARLPSGFSLTAIDSSQAILNLISGTMACLHGRTAEPVHLCQILLYLAQFMQDVAIRTHQDELSKAFQELASSMMQKNSETAYINFHSANLSLKYALRLNDRHRGLIKPSFISLLSSMCGST